MCTKAILQKNKNNLKYLYKKSQMILIQLKDKGGDELKNEYYDILEAFEYELDKYYANYIMFLKIEENKLFETFLSLKKERVKRNMLSNFIKEFDSK